MDNFSFDITANDNLQGWLDCCMGHRKAVGWSVHYDNGKEESRLIFYWVSPPHVDKYQSLPSPADTVQVCTIAESWLDVVNRSKPPNHDGSNGKGFRLYNEAWGHVDGHSQGLLAITPAWAMYGK